MWSSPAVVGDLLVFGLGSSPNSATQDFRGDVLGVRRCDGSVVWRFDVTRHEGVDYSVGVSVWSSAAVVFNHAKPNGAGGTDRRELAVMDYDYATNTFSNLRVVVSNLGPAPSLPYAPAPAGAGPVPTGWGGCVDSTVMYYGGDTGALNPGSCTGPCYPAFPFFTPDGRGVVFSLTSEPDFTNAFPGRDMPAKSELWYVELATLSTTPLTNINNALNAADRMADYFPTVLPVGVGGNFWVFWTSRRAVGHRVIGIGGEILPGISFPGASQLDATKKRIWAAAIDINPLAAGGVLMDPSHPGFYLPGQSDSGNVRAFAALNPCRPTGGDCQSGLDCCSGFCNIAQGATAGTCVDEPPAVCSRENERCSTDADCCPAESGPRLEFLTATDEYPYDPAGFPAFALWGAAIMTVTTVLSSLGTQRAAVAAQPEEASIKRIRVRDLHAEVRGALGSANYRAAVIGGMLGAVGFGLAESPIAYSRYGLTRQGHANIVAALNERRGAMQPQAAAAE